VKLIYADGGNDATHQVPVTAADRARLVLSDDEALALARWGVAIEQHYGVAMDIEWAKDGRSGELYIVQARPETINAEPARNAQIAINAERVFIRGPHVRAAQDSAGRFARDDRGP
jgi:pyruvate,water dikinase